MPAPAQTPGSPLGGSDSATPTGSPRAPTHLFVPSSAAGSQNQATGSFAIANWISRMLAMAQPGYLGSPAASAPPSASLGDQSAPASALAPTIMSSLPGAVGDAADSPFSADFATRTQTQRAMPHPAAQRSTPHPAAQRSAPASTSSPVSAGAWNVAPIVTWYGPGFYNHRTACGQRYTRTIIGFASRTLPCGTLVQFRWHGMTAIAPVIDRGPYASAAYVFDWSAALACKVFRPRGVKNSCYTRHRVQWRVVKRRH